MEGLRLRDFMNGVTAELSVLGDASYVEHDGDYTVLVRAGDMAVYVVFLNKTYTGEYPVVYEVWAVNRGGVRKKLGLLVVREIEKYTGSALMEFDIDSEKVSSKYISWYDAGSDFSKLLIKSLVAIFPELVNNVLDRLLGVLRNSLVRELNIYGAIVKLAPEKKEVMVFRSDKYRKLIIPYKIVIALNPGLIAYLLRHVPESLTVEELDKILAKLDGSVLEVPGTKYVVKVEMASGVSGEDNVVDTKTMYKIVDEEAGEEYGEAKLLYQLNYVETKGQESIVDELVSKIIDGAKTYLGYSMDKIIKKIV